MSRARRWCYTLNNYSPSDEVLFISLSPVQYHVFGKETGDSGTPHLQGFVIFSKPYRLGGVKKIHPTAHWEITKGTSLQASHYCKKGSGIPENPIDPDVFEFGTIVERGTRSDLDAFKTVVKAGEYNLKRLREEFTEVVAKFPRFVHDYIKDQQPEPVVPEHELRSWQIELDSLLAHPPDDRKVIFVVDYVGNKGKTWFAKRYCEIHPDGQLLEPAKKSDMAHALQPQLRVLFINVTRQSDSKNLEYLYSFIESVKDGCVFSGKYESSMKKYVNIHVVVLMNFDPNMDLLSQDRYHVMTI